MTKMEQIQEFLGQKRFAMAGVSQRADDFSRVLFREFRRRGYEAIPVNPGAKEIDGERCFARVQDVEPPVETVLCMTSPAVTASVVKDCVEGSVRRVWMYRAGGQGAVSQAAVEMCEANGIAVIPGECPFMFLSGSAWYHRLHGLIRKISGSYPH